MTQLRARYSSSSLKVIQACPEHCRRGGDKRATERMSGGIAAGYPPAYSLRVKTVQVVRLGASAGAWLLPIHRLYNHGLPLAGEANAVALINMELELHP